MSLKSGNWQPSPEAGGMSLGQEIRGLFAETERERRQSSKLQVQQRTEESHLGWKWSRSNGVCKWTDWSPGTCLCPGHRQGPTPAPEEEPPHVTLPLPQDTNITSRTSHPFIDAIILTTNRLPSIVNHWRKVPSFPQSLSLSLPPERNQNKQKKRKRRKERKKRN